MRKKYNDVYQRMKLLKLNCSKSSTVNKSDWKIHKYTVIAPTHGLFTTKLIKSYQKYIFYNGCSVNILF